MFLPNPVDQLADAGVGQAARLPRRSRSSRRGVAARGRKPSGCARRVVSQRGRLDLGVFLGLQFLLGKRGPVVVAVDALGEQIELARLASRGLARLASAASQCRCTVRRWTRSVRAKLRSRRAAVAAGRRSSRPAAACLRLVSPSSRSSRSSRYWSSRPRAAARGVGRQAVDVDLHDDALRETALDGSRRSSLSRRTMTSSSSFLLVTGTPRQKRCGSRISSRAEKLLEWPLCGVAERKSRCSNRAARSRTARVIFESMAYFCAARRGGVVGLVEDQQRAGPEVAEPVAQRGRRRLRRSAGGARPGTASGCVQGLTPKPRSCRTRGDVVLVEDLEDQAEAVFQLVLPLKEHRRRAGDDDVLDFLAEQQLAGDQAGLDRLAEADVVGDEEVDPRQAQGLAERLELVGVDPDAGPERRLEQLRVGRGDAVPAERVQVGGEELGGSNPRAAIACQASPVMISASTSFSQSTSSGCPWASSSTQDSRTSVASSPGLCGTTSSTRYCRCRTRTIWPASGTSIMVLTSGCAQIRRALFDLAKNRKRTLAAVFRIASARILLG